MSVISAGMCLAWLVHQALLQPSRWFGSLACSLPFSNPSPMGSAAPCASFHLPLILSLSEGCQNYCKTIYHCRNLTSMPILMHLFIVPGNHFWPLLASINQCISISNKLKEAHGSFSPQQHRSEEYSVWHWPQLARKLMLTYTSNNYSFVRPFSSDGKQASAVGPIKRSEN